MSITPQLEDSIAGKYTKEISDFLALDVKDSNGVLETLQRMYKEVYEEAYDEGSYYGRMSKS